jgi:hypothetical protein
MELAQMQTEQFRRDHPDIKPDSSEEFSIAEKIRQGYLPEDAYRSVMWDVKVVEADKKAKQNIQQKTEAKKQANVEQRSIPTGATSPTNEKLSLRQRIEREANKLEW